MITSFRHRYSLLNDSVPDFISHVSRFCLEQLIRTSNMFRACNNSINTLRKPTYKYDTKCTQNPALLLNITNLGTGHMPALKCTLTPDWIKYKSGKSDVKFEIQEFQHACIHAYTVLTHARPEGNYVNCFRIPFLQHCDVFVEARWHLVLVPEEFAWLRQITNVFKVSSMS